MIFVMIFAKAEISHLNALSNETVMSLVNFMEGKLLDKYFAMPHLNKFNLKCVTHHVVE